MYKTGVVLLLIALAALGAESQALHPDIIEDSFLTTIGLVRKYGYPGEEHIVRTDDGYLLEVHRIPGSPQSPPAPGKPVVLLFHGMLSSSADWVLMGPNNGFAYMLADLGYDVWMGNARGNRYGRMHIHHNPSSSDFWGFSWHEVGLIDIPNTIEYILQNTGQQRLHYVGHSQGTTAFWVMCSERPFYMSRIISMQALAPAAYMHHTRSPYVIMLSTFLWTMDMALQMMGTHYFAPNSDMDILGGILQCMDGAPSQLMCANNIFLLAGYNTQEMNFTMLPVINAHSPAGAATRQMIHFGQVVRSRTFQMYDHGALNMIHYGQLLPPRYQLSRVTVPVSLYHSFNDWLAPPEDVQLLQNELPNVSLSYRVPQLAFNHLDFVWAINARSLLYDRIVQDLREKGN